MAPEKDTRNVFRKYMADNPDKYDYSKAQVRCPYANTTRPRELVGSHVA